MPGRIYIKSEWCPARRNSILPDVETNVDTCGSGVVSPGYSFQSHAYIVTRAACQVLLDIHCERDLPVRRDELASWVGSSPHFLVYVGMIDVALGGR